MDKTVSENNKRIAKNTILLYVRMVITMCIGLFTSRIVLQNLGVVDYGINNVVAGMVTMFTFLNSTLASGTQRFITFALGERDIDKCKRTFSTTFVVHLVMAIALSFVILIGGLWFMNGQLSIPQERMDAAYWVFYTAIITILLNITQVPYMSTIIAHENMSVYAYMTIYDAVAKLIVAFSLLFSTVDNLKLFAILNLIISGASILIYRIYCIKKYEECTVSWQVDKKLLKSILGFSGWNVFGCAAVIMNNQGVNILLNMFFGPIVNAARGIANRLNSIVLQLVQNFQTAANPQIVKYHAAGEDDRMINLILNNARYAGLLMAFVLVPLYVEAPFVLKIWLGEVPAETVFFTRIILIQSLIQTMSRPGVMGIHAVGNMKTVNILAGGNLLLILPATWIMLKLGIDLETVLIINIIPWLIEPIIEMILLNKYIGFPIMRFYTYVYGNVLSISVISYILTLLVHRAISNEIAAFFAACSTSVIVSGCLIYYWGLNKTMRNTIKNKIITKFKKS